MTLYTSKVVAAWLGVTERRVRQLRDEGVIAEVRPNLYDLRGTIHRYINFLRHGSNDLNDERIKLTRAKREAAELDNALKRGQLHKAEDIEEGIQAVFLNIRSRFLALPAKLSHVLAAEEDERAVFDELEKAIRETLEELSDYKAIMAESQEEKREESRGAEGE